MRILAASAILLSAAACMPDDSRPPPSADAGADVSPPSCRAKPTCAELGGCRAVSLSVAADHACAVVEGGRVACWGKGFSEELRLVADVCDVTDVSTGTHHTCARTGAGRVVCWGDNVFGQLGAGDDGPHEGVVSADGIDDAAEVTAGTFFTCVRHATGKVSCWGSNGSGELGDPAAGGAFRGRPGEVPGVDDARSIHAGGAFACAVRANGEALCWGSNANGELARAPLERNVAPAAISGIGPVSHLSTGVQHACALIEDGRVMCWGDNRWGQLGTASAEEPVVTPVPVPQIEGLTELSAGGGYTCALSGDGAIRCWGNDRFGQLGAGSAAPAPTGACDILTEERRVSTEPLGVLGVTDARAVSAGQDHACALRSEGAIACWGSNAALQLGVGPQVMCTDEPLPLGGTGR